MRNDIYNHLLKNIPSPENIPCFNKGGKLIICLIEYRIMPEIDWVINAVLRVYKSSEIGFSIVYGTKNASYIEERYSKWENIILVNTGHENQDRGSYSGLLKMYSFYKPYENWSHMLIYQTDALLIQKINDVYFQYDYVGAPWKLDNQCAKYSAGNGGFSLRNVKSCLKVCEPFKNIPHEKMHRGNEDIFFCEQDSFNYIPINTDLHYKFSIERVKFPRPIGCHQIMRCWEMNNEEYMDFISFAWKKLVYKISLTEEEIFEDSKIYNNYIGKFLDKKAVINKKQIIRAPVHNNTTNNTTNNASNNEKGIITKNNYLKQNDIVINDGETKTVKEMLNVLQNMGSFHAIYLNEVRNKWSVTCDCDYEILFCQGPDPNKCIEKHSVDRKHEAGIHKLEKGCIYKEDDKYGYLIFYPGFPDGGKSYADVHAPWGNNFNKCKAVPKDGSIILKSLKKLTPEQQAIVDKEKLEEEKKLEEEQQKKIERLGFDKVKENILVYDLFSGVGFYNQLFSFENAVYLANISNRHLFLNIKHPLVSCGRPDKSLGPLTNYLSDEYKQFLPKGITIFTPDDSFDIDNNLLDMPSKISSMVIVDNELDTQENKDDINEFLHWRIKQNGKEFFDTLFSDNKIVCFKKSNASRFFTNYYTTDENYKLMSKIAYSISRCHPIIDEVFNLVKKELPAKYISFHFRFGDWHKSTKDISSSNDNYQNNIFNWLEKNNSENLPLYLMVDRKDNPLLEEMKKKWNIFFTDELIKEEHKDKIKTVFPTSHVAEFLIEKKICENAYDFVGSQGSTVSVHIQYNNFLNGKDFNKYFYTRSTAFNHEKLMFNVNDNKKYTWAKKNYMGGHPMSWSIFFEDNIYK